MNKISKIVLCLFFSLMFVVSGILPCLPTGLAFADTNKPNILVIMGDDIGWFNISAYNRGIMGYRTPNIDNLAKEGIMFTDYYGENSCTAGRAAFITGQASIRTGMTKVGLPSVPVGLKKEDPTLAELLKPLGYRTGQFGKNHLGDLDEYLPTAHGFDEFFGNLYHLNAEEEPENEDYLPEGKSPIFDQFRPRGVLHSFAGKNSYTCDPTQNETPAEEVGETGDQVVCNTGALTKKRMETIDEEVLGHTQEFIADAQKAGEPFFVWFNTTRMHVFTHLKEESQGVTGQGIEADGMVEHDQQVGSLINFLKDKGLDENTIIIYTTDNGAEVFSWPDGGTTPFHGEKNTNWEGGFRVPAIVRWKNHFPEGVVSNEIMSHIDWVPTLMAAAGVDNIQRQLLADGDDLKLKAQYPEYEQYAVHLDGYNFLPYLYTADRLTNHPEFKKNCPINSERSTPSYCSPRNGYIYFTDDGYPSAVRYNDWKLIFKEQRAEGFDVWAEPFVDLRVPIIINLRRDPFEKAPHESEYYADWKFRRIFLAGPITSYVAGLLQTFVDYPPRQKPASFTIDQIVDGVVKKVKIDRLKEKIPVITPLRELLEKLVDGVEN
ncbi:arylsulfatase [Nostoc sp. FACHB-87]|uniref:arylsulfatase n=1 Tax=Nostocaceae TaxID=1162 RepID=UPI00168620E7|nr:MULTISPECIES: arylsulfatase [Nostocaceae]MBD2297589.1 arylsulfatase [Nostoc sp. FACHB-190]MBD2453883.1 arylsulfatase [Nostoc sp. FACHB-87]MBD2476006.1 arylsulfatase [Anabaena sp. FACHB-83]